MEDFKMIMSEAEQKRLNLTFYDGLEKGWELAKNAMSGKYDAYFKNTSSSILKDLSAREVFEKVEEVEKCF